MGRLKNSGRNAGNAEWVALSLPTMAPSPCLGCSSSSQGPFIRFRRRPRPEESAVALPEEIFLPALEERWQVSYLPGDSGSVAARCDGRGRLIVSGRIGHRADTVRALKRWLSRKARATLVPWLQELSHEAGLKFRRVSIRGQRSRWGSCSVEGDISLNYKLLFLPPDLVRYVLLHELCHTTHPDHSRDFWERLVRLEPEAVYLRRQASGTGMESIPEWAR